MVRVRTTLVRLDAKYNVVPAIAKSWEFSSDGLTLTLSITANPLDVAAGSAPGVQFPAVITDAIGITRKEIKCGVVDSGRPRGTRRYWCRTCSNDSRVGKHQRYEH